MRFLVSRLSALGDVVCSLPAASALKAGHPDCEIVWAVSPKFSDVVRCCSAVDRVAGPDEVKGETFDAALDLQGLLKSARVIAGVRAGLKLGYHWQREGSALFAERVSPDPTSLHVVDQYVDVARAAGGIAHRAEFNVVPDEDALASVREKLQDLKNFVVINPGAAWASKRWPAQNVATLIDALEAPTVLIGAKGETSASEALALSQRGALDLSGATSLKELIALISLAEAHVGGDTGSTHIAAALGVPAVGLYASTRLERSCPYGQIGRCLYNPNGLAAIQPSEVLAKVREAIA